MFLFNFIIRQASYQEQHEPVSPVKKLTATKVKTPIKMKPRPHGVDFEEIDVRKILKPFSHSKYIKVRKILRYLADLYMFSRETNTYKFLTTNIYNHRTYIHLSAFKCKSRQITIYVFVLE